MDDDVKECLYCGEEFRRETQGPKIWEQQKYCGMTCAKQGGMGHKREKKISEPHGPLKTKCAHCGKEVLDTEVVYDVPNDVEWCSDKCQMEYWSSHD